MASSAKEQADAPPEVQHQFHFRYDRRLSCFSNSVSCLNFTTDGHFLVSGTGSGDIKVWDASTWAEAAKLKSGRRAEPKEVAISPSQRWVVVCYSAMLQIFQCGPPWKLITTRPIDATGSNKEAPPEWCCVAFSPSMAEVDHPGGQAGQDNHLAAFSNCHISLMDYSGGWSQDVPQRTRSLMQTAWPSSLSYTGDGYWIICGFSEGQMQIWNAFSLSLEKTLNAHEATVTSIAASPPQAPYDARLVSCSKDQCLRVWHVNTWLLEQHVHELRCDRGGLRCCNFSATGNWLVAVAAELTVWRVYVSARLKKFELQMHQRLEAVCGSESIRTATFSSQSEVIAVGSHDGILGLWSKHQGLPPAAPEQLPSASNPAQSAGESSRNAGAPSPSESSLTMTKLARPMQRITPQGVKPLGSQAEPQRTRPSLPPHRTRSTIGGMSPVAVGGRLSLQLNSDIASMVRSDSPSELRQPRGRQTCKTSTLLGGWQPSCFDDVFSHVKSVDSNTGLLSNADRVTDKAPNKELMARARGLVKRIALDPKVITKEEKSEGRS